MIQSTTCSAVETKTIGVLVCQKFATVPTHVDNKELVPAFERHNLQYKEVVWDDPNVDFRDYDAILVRATWDYIEKRERFLEVMQAIAAACIPLFNPLPTLEWNSNKSYLFDLQSRGIVIIPTCVVSRKTTPSLSKIVQASSEEIFVIKPAVSGGAHRTFRAKAQEVQALYETHYALEEEVLIQPFLEEVTQEGEWSLIFFNGVFSHAVLSKPKDNDFRVQRMHGGTVTLVEPVPEMVVEAAKVVALTKGGIPLYARVDFIRQKNRFLLMELEVIEPALFLKFDPDRAAERFTQALLRVIK